MLDKDLMKKEINKKLSELHFNDGLKELLKFIGGDDYIRNLSVALTHFCFRGGPVEGMHSGTVSYMNATPDTPPESISQLSQEDMKTLNKYMVDKLGLFLTLLVNEHYIELKSLVMFHQMYGSDWDPPNIEKGMDSILRLI